MNAAAIVMPVARRRPPWLSRTSPAARDGAHRARGPAERVLRSPGAGGSIGHGFGTSSITVVPEPGDEKIRARPPTVLRRPTTDSA